MPTSIRFYVKNCQVFAYRLGDSGSSKQREWENLSAWSSLRPPDGLRWRWKIFFLYLVKISPPIYLQSSFEGDQNLIVFGKNSTKFENETKLMEYLKTWNETWDPMPIIIYNSVGGWMVWNFHMLGRWQQSISNLFQLLDKFSINFQILSGSFLSH